MVGKTWTAGEPKEQEKTITEQLNEIVDKFCEDYCKYPDICMAKTKDPEAADDLLYTEYCETCPFSRI